MPPVVSVAGKGLLSMQFSAARPDVVRAINQRWLLTFWNRHRGDLAVPKWQVIEAENLSRMADTLSFLDVIRGEPDLRFVTDTMDALVPRKSKRCPTSLHA